MRLFLPRPRCLGCDFAGILLFFFNDTATTEIYTLSLHDALPIWRATTCPLVRSCPKGTSPSAPPDRQSTRLNSSHANISYAVFCMKKKTQITFANKPQKARSMEGIKNTNT